MSAAGIAAVQAGTDMSPTAALAGCIAASPPAVDGPALAAARRGVLDFLASAVAGTGDPTVATFWSALGRTAGGGNASVIGFPRRLDPAGAALVNGFVGHAIDFDDIHRSVRGHPSTVILPALFAFAEDRGAAFDALLAAYVTGIETMALLGRALGTRHYERGFHSTSVVGSLGAAAAVASLAGLDAAGVANALGIAATQSAGLRVQFGSEVKPLHAGMAARAGLQAAQLAESGLSGAADALGGRIGFLEAFEGSEDVFRAGIEGWGRPWQILEPGLIFKEYPCCGGNHYAADAILGLYAEGLRAADVDTVDVILPPGGDAALVVTEARTGLEGRFCIEYVIATGLIEGALRPDAFMDRPTPPEVAGLMGRVRRVIDSTAPRAANDPATRFSTVVVSTRDGREITRTVSRRPRGAQDLAAKFRDAARGLDGLDDVPDLVAGASSAADLSTILRRLADCRGPDAGA